MAGLSRIISCPDCREIVGPEPVSRAYVNEIHNHHRPPHPNQVGPAHRRQARIDWDEWQTCSPYND